VDTILHPHFIFTRKKNEFGFSPFPIHFGIGNWHWQQWILATFPTVLQQHNLNSNEAE
jgi:hypothetical protein